MPSRKIRKRKKRRSLKRRLAAKLGPDKTGSTSSDEETDTSENECPRGTQGLPTGGGDQVKAGKMGQGDSRGDPRPFQHHHHHHASHHHHHHHHYQQQQQQQHHCGSTCGHGPWREMGFRGTAPQHAHSQGHRGGASGLRRTASAREHTSQAFASTHRLQRTGSAREPGGRPHSGRKLQKNELYTQSSDSISSSWTDISKGGKTSSESLNAIGSSGVHSDSSNKKPGGLSTKGPPTAGHVKRPLKSTSSEENIRLQENARSQKVRVDSIKEDPHNKQHVGTTEEENQKGAGPQRKRSARRRKRRKSSTTEAAGDHKGKDSDGGVFTDDIDRRVSSHVIAEPQKQLTTDPTIDSANATTGLGSLQEDIAAEDVSKQDGSVRMEADHKDNVDDSATLMSSQTGTDRSTSDDHTDATLQDYNISTTRTEEWVSETWDGGTMQTAWAEPIGYQPVWEDEFSLRMSTLPEPYTTKKNPGLAFAHQGESMESSEYAADDESTPKDEMSFDHFDLPGGAPVAGSLLFGGLGALEKATSLITKLAKEMSPEPKSPKSIDTSLGDPPAICAAQKENQPPAEWLDHQQVICLESQLIPKPSEPTAVRGGLYSEAQAEGWEIINKSGDSLRTDPAQCMESDPLKISRHLMTHDSDDDVTEQPNELFISEPDSYNYIGGYSFDAPLQMPMDLVLSLELDASMGQDEPNEEISEPPAASTGVPFYSRLPSIEHMEFTCVESRKQCGAPNLPVNTSCTSSENPKADCFEDEADIEQNVVIECHQAHELCEEKKVEVHEQVVTPEEHKKDLMRELKLEDPVVQEDQEHAQLQANTPVEDDVTWSREGVPTIFISDERPLDKERTPVAYDSLEDECPQPVEDPESMAKDEPIIAQYDSLEEDYIPPALVLDLEEKEAVTDLPDVEKLVDSLDEMVEESHPATVCQTDKEPVGEEQQAVSKTEVGLTQKVQQESEMDDDTPKFGGDSRNGGNFSDDSLDHGLDTDTQDEQVRTEDQQVSTREQAEEIEDPGEEAAMSQTSLLSSVGVGGQATCVDVEEPTKQVDTLEKTLAESVPVQCSTKTTELSAQHSLEQPDESTTDESSAQDVPELNCVQMYLEVCSSMQKDQQVLGMLTLAKLAETRYHEHLALQQAEQILSGEIEDLSKEAVPQATREHTPEAADRMMGETQLTKEEREVPTHEKESIVPADEAVDNRAVVTDMQEYQVALRDLAQGQAAEERYQEHICATQEPETDITHQAGEEPELQHVSMFEGTAVPEPLVPVRTPSQEDSVVAVPVNTPSQEDSAIAEPVPVPTPNQEDTVPDAAGHEVEKAILSSLGDVQRRLGELAQAQAAEEQHEEYRAAASANLRTEEVTSNLPTAKDEEAIPVIQQTEKSDTLVTSEYHTQDCQEKAAVTDDKVSKEAMRASMEDEQRRLMQLVLAETAEGRFEESRASVPSGGVESLEVEEASVPLEQPAEVQQLPVKTDTECSLPEEPVEREEQREFGSTADVGSIEEEHLPLVSAPLQEDAIRSSLKDDQWAVSQLVQAEAAEKQFEEYRAEDPVYLRTVTFLVAVEIEDEDETEEHDTMSSYPDVPVCLAMQSDQMTLQQAVLAAQAESIYQENRMKHTNGPAKKEVPVHHNAPEPGLKQSENKRKEKVVPKLLQTTPAHTQSHKAVQQSLQTDYQKMQWMKSAEFAETMYHETIVRFVEVVFHEPRDSPPKEVKEEPKIPKVAEASTVEVTTKGQEVKSVELPIPAEETAPQANDVQKAPMANPASLTTDEEKCEIIDTPSVQLTDDVPEVVEEQVESFTRQNVSASAVEESPVVEGVVTVQPMTVESRREHAEENIDKAEVVSSPDMKQPTPSEDVPVVPSVANEVNSHPTETSSDESKKDADASMFAHTFMREDEATSEAHDADPNQEVTDRVATCTPEPYNCQPHVAGCLQDDYRKLQWMKQAEYAEGKALSSIGHEVSEKTLVVDCRKLEELSVSQSSPDDDNLEEERHHQAETASKVTSKAPVAQEQGEHLQAVTAVAVEGLECDDQNRAEACTTQQSPAHISKEPVHPTAVSKKEELSVSSVETNETSDDSGGIQQVDLAIDEALAILSEDEADDGTEKTHSPMVTSEKETSRKLSQESIEGLANSLVDFALDDAFSVLQSVAGDQIITLPKDSDDDSLNDGSETRMGDLFSDSEDETEKPITNVADQPKYVKDTKVDPNVSQPRDGDDDSLNDGLETRMGDLFSDSEDETEKKPIANVADLPKDVKETKVDPKVLQPKDDDDNSLNDGTETRMGDLFSDSEDETKKKPIRNIADLPKDVKDPDVSQPRDGDDNSLNDGSEMRMGDLFSDSEDETEKKPLGNIADLPKDVKDPDVSQPRDGDDNSLNDGSEMRMGDLFSDSEDETEKKPIANVADQPKDVKDPKVLQSKDGDADSLNDGTETRMGDLFSDSEDETEKKPIANVGDLPKDVKDTKVDPNVSQPRDDDDNSLNDGTETRMGDLFSDSEDETEKKPIANVAEPPKVVTDMQHSPVSQPRGGDDDSLNDGSETRMGDLFSDSEEETEKKPIANVSAPTVTQSKDGDDGSLNDGSDTRMGDLFSDSDAEEVIVKTSVDDVHSSPAEITDEIIETEIIEEYIETIEEIVESPSDDAAAGYKHMLGTAKATAEDVDICPGKEAKEYLASEGQRLEGIQVCTASETVYQEHIANIEDLNNNNMLAAAAASATPAASRSQENVVQSTVPSREGLVVHEELGERVMTKFNRDAFSPPVGFQPGEKALASEILADSGFWEEVWQSYREECRALWQLAVCEQAENLYQERQSATARTVPTVPQPVEHILSEERASSMDEPKPVQAVEEVHNAIMTTCSVEINMPDVFGVAFVEASCRDYEQMKQTKEAESAEETFMSTYVIENEDCQELIEIFGDQIQTIDDGRGNKPEETIEAATETITLAAPVAVSPCQNVGIYKSLCSHLDPYADSDSEEECDVHGNIAKWKSMERQRIEETRRDIVAETVERCSPVVQLESQPDDIPSKAQNDDPPGATAQLEETLSPCCKCDVLTLPLDERFKQELRKETGQRVALEQLVKILEKEGKDLRQNLMKQQDDNSDLRLSVNQLQKQLTGATNASETESEDLKKTLQNKDDRIAQLEKELEEKNKAYQGLSESMIDARLMENKLANAQAKIRMLEVEVVASHKRGRLLLSKLASVDRDRSLIIKETVHTELLSIADGRANLADVQVEQLEHKLKEAKNHLEEERLRKRHLPTTCHSVKDYPSLISTTLASASGALFNPPDVSTSSSSRPITSSTMSSSVPTSKASSGASAKKVPRQHSPGTPIPGSLLDDMDSDIEEPNPSGNSFNFQVFSMFGDQEHQPMCTNSDSISSASTSGSGSTTATEDSPDRQTPGSHFFSSSGEDQTLSGGQKRAGSAGSSSFQVTTPKTTSTLFKPITPSEDRGFLDDVDLPEFGNVHSSTDMELRISESLSDDPSDLSDWSSSESEGAAGDECELRIVESEIDLQPGKLAAAAAAPSSQQRPTPPQTLISGSKPKVPPRVSSLWLGKKYAGQHTDEEKARLGETHYIKDPNGNQELPTTTL